MVSALHIALLGGDTELDTVKGAGKLQKSETQFKDVSENTYSIPYDGSLKVQYALVVLAFIIS